MLLPQYQIGFDTLNDNLLTKKNINLKVARLDKIHNEVSGNKIFKLHYFVEACLQSTNKTMLTFGGAYSNHLAATAFLCRQEGLHCIGIVRGEAAPDMSHTLMRCKKLGMQLLFVTREEYKALQTVDHRNILTDKFGECTIVPEGGFAPAGAKGAALIMDILQQESPDYICTATGTATTLAGLLMNKKNDQQIISVPVIMNMTDINERVKHLTGLDEHPIIFSEYHFGGYAKYTADLIAFMNNFFLQQEIPTDFVYTGKLMYAIMDQLKKGFFKNGSKIICLHTGGLQGNLSLPKNTLKF